jgi:hypothetical protein
MLYMQLRRRKASAMQRPLQKDLLHAMCQVHQKHQERMPLQMLQTL